MYFIENRSELSSCRSQMSYYIRSARESCWAGSASEFNFRGTRMPAGLEARTGDAGMWGPASLLEKSVATID
jgi:hypothetical protein